MATSKKGTPRGGAPRRRKATSSDTTKGKKAGGRKGKAAAGNAPARAGAGEAAAQSTRKVGRERGSSAISRKLAEDFFKRIREIKNDNPETTRVIDKQERAIHRSLWSIREAIDLMAPQERELVRILVINGIYKASDEILLEDQ